MILNINSTRGHTGSLLVITITKHLTNTDCPYHSPHAFELPI